MAPRIVTNAKFGIDPAIDTWVFQIQGDPSVAPGLKAGVGSIAYQSDNATTPGQEWNKTTTSDTGWTQVGATGTSGQLSASGAFRVSAYSVPVDGSTDSTTAWNTMLSANVPASGGPYTVVVGPGETLHFIDDITIPPTVKLQGTGGTIKMASGKTLTFMHPPESAGKIFDASAGGLFVAGGPMTVRPEWWGAWESGAADASVDRPSIMAGIQSLWPNGGGTLLCSQMYAVDTEMDLSGTDFDGLTIQGTGAGECGWIHTQDGTRGIGLLHLIGETTAGITNLAFRDITIRGNGVTDLTQLLVISDFDGLMLERVKIYDNGSEGIYFAGAQKCVNVEARDCYAENVGMGTQKLSAYNFSAENASLINCKAVNCGQTCEQQGDNFRMIGCHSEGASFVHLGLASTYSAYWDGTQEITYSTAVVSGNLFLGGAVAITMNDVNGHTAEPGDHVLHGNSGRMLITGNIARGCVSFYQGGADQLNEVVITGNFIEDASAATKYAIDCTKGRFTISNNVFKLGVTSAWAGIIRCGTADPVNTSGIVSYNTIIGVAWTGSAFTVGPELTLAHNIFEAPSASSYRYQFDGTNQGTDGSISVWRPSADTWLPNQDADFVYAPSQTSKIRVNGSYPLKGTWQVGDRAENIGLSGISGWLCTVGGTADTILSGVTITTTNGSKNFTVTAGKSKLVRYQWITIPGVTGAKQLATYDPSAGTGTFQSNASATVTDQTPAYSAPTWVASNNVASLTATSQATGDMIYASSSTLFSRLAAGTNGKYLSMVSGVPAWTDVVARYDAGNSSTAITVTRTPERQEQKVTLSTATPAVTIDDTAIPSGGYLITDFFQDATGSRVPTWALTSAGTINWVGGSAPTLTTTAAKADRIVWHNEGSRVTAWASLQNF